MVFSEARKSSVTLCREWDYDVTLLNRFIWQRSGKGIYPAKEIIFACYYNRNEPETVVADQLKQASSTYYPSRIYRIDKNYSIYSRLQVQGYFPIRPLPKVTMTEYW
jgi:hypothetical protein